MKKKELVITVTKRKGIDHITVKPTNLSKPEILGLVSIVLNKEMDRIKVSQVK